MSENKRSPIIIAVGLLILVLGFAGYLFVTNYCSVGSIVEKVMEHLQLGSVNVSHEYNATSTRYMAGGLAKSAGYQVVATTSHGGTVLGSIVVASTTNHALKIVDATSSAGITNGDYEEVVTMATSTDAGTYQLDAYLKYGLILWFPTGFAGDYVITWR